MARYIFVVHSGPQSGRLEDYNQWYENVHLKEVLRVPGFVAAERFELHGEPYQGTAPPHRFLCIYEMDTDDPQATLAALTVAAAHMNVSSALDRDHAVGLTYRATGRRHLTLESAR